MYEDLTYHLSEFIITIKKQNGGMMDKLTKEV